MEIRKSPRGYLQLCPYDGCPKGRVKQVFAIDRYFLNSSRADGGPMDLAVGSAGNVEANPLYSLGLVCAPGSGAASPWPLQGNSEEICLWRPLPNPLPNP